MMEMSENAKSILEELKLSSLETYYHCVHVKSLVYKMIRYMNREGITNYAQEEIDYICKGAILHDVGKLAVNNYILTKDSKLTTEERNSIIGHTKASFDMLKDDLNDSELDYIKNICLYHHERVDGKGYEGVSDIPMYVQVVAICDVFDALSTDRVYRKALSYEDTISAIKEGASGIFDKQVIECLEQVTKTKEK